MRGEDAVVIVYFGDGASSVGDCHEGMNFAAIHDLPVVFFCENNKYAISVPLAKQMAVDSVAGRAEGYGMPGIAIDGSDVTAVYEATSEAAARARRGDGPTVVEAMVERYLPHTSDDDDSRYRPGPELEEARKPRPDAPAQADPGRPWRADRRGGRGNSRRSQARGRRGHGLRRVSAIPRD